MISKIQRSWRHFRDVTIIRNFQTDLETNTCGARAPYLVDCKRRLTKRFSSFRAVYNRGRLTLFFFSLSKCLDDAQSFLGYVVSTKLSFRILPSFWHLVHTPSQEGSWWTEGTCIGVSFIITYVGCQLNVKGASTRRYCGGLGNLCSRVAYN